MLTGEELGHAIAEAIKLKGVTQRAVAAHFGVKPPSIQDWIRRGTIDKGKLQALWEFFGDVVGPEHWGLAPLPEDVMLSIADSPPVSIGLRAPAPDDLEIVQYEAGGAMGTGLVLEDQPPGHIKSWRVDQEWLRLNVRHHTGTKNLCIVTGFGPSMRPKYNPGDPLLMDRGVTRVDHEGVYFFRVGDQGFIKQLQRIPTEAGLIIRVKSFNTDYDPWEITEKMDFEVFGKILTAWKSEQF